MSTYFLSCPRGLEQVTHDQLSQYINDSINIESGGISFNGGLKEMYSVNLHSRTGMYLFKQLYQLKINKAEKLYSIIYQLDWHSLIGTEKTFSIRTKLRSRLFDHSNYVTLKIKDAIVDKIRKKYSKRPSINKIDPDISLMITLIDNQLSIYLNSTGVPLFKRGYRTQIHKAALNEALAAGIVLLSNWDRKSSFYDIMCGFGTIPLEAAMIAYNIAPGLYKKDYAFQKWDDYDSKLWNKTWSRAKEKINLDSNIKIFGSDHINHNINVSTKSAEMLGIEKNIMFCKLDIHQFNPKDDSGTIIINPPYGNRMGPNDNIKELYKNLGDIFKTQCSGYEVFIFTGNLDAAKSIGLRSKKRIILKNGKIDCRLLYYPISSGKFS